MYNKKHTIGVIFAALIIILAMNPKIVHNMYEKILGRIFLICLIVFFASNNTTLGLLIVLIIITATNQFGSFVEGFEEKDKLIVLTKSATEESVQGVDKEVIKNAIMSKDSKSIPVDENMNKSSEVKASSVGLLAPNMAKLEGFSAFKSV
jgi:hypothetical protein